MCSPDANRSCLLGRGGHRSLRLAAIAHAIDCSGLPNSLTGGEFPTGKFVANFNNNPCYTIALGGGNGSGEYGDLNAEYFQFYFRVDPQYQLIVVGSFPRATRTRRAT